MAACKDFSGFQEYPCSGFFFIFKQKGLSTFFCPMDDFKYTGLTAEYKHNASLPFHLFLHVHGGGVPPHLQENSLGPDKCPGGIGCQLIHYLIQCTSCLSLEIIVNCTKPA